MQVRSVVFGLEKAGNAAKEWEDGVGAFDGDPVAGRNPRYIVVDGATEAYDSLRWVDHLVTSFIGDGSSRKSQMPSLDAESMQRWFELMQERWVAEAPAVFANIFEERTFAQVGSFATLLGCELTGLDGPNPSWDAVALGDTVLFQVRDRRLVVQFPQLGADDFGLSPDGVHTQSAALEQMRRRLTFAHGSLAEGDQLFLTTDAFAHWIIRYIRGKEREVWNLLATLDHPRLFEQLIADHRAAGEMKNDDVTLLRVHVAADAPAFLVVSLP